MIAIRSSYPRSCPRSCSALSLLPRCHRFRSRPFRPRILSSSSLSSIPPLNSSPNCVLLASLENNIRFFSSTFGTISNPHLQNNSTEHENEKEGIGRRSNTRTRNAARAEHNDDSYRYKEQSNHKSNPRKHSVRLIGEVAARRTTQLFVEAYNHDCSLIYGATTKHDNDGVPPWRDAATLLAAEQALEFWAHRNNDGGRCERRRSSGPNQKRSPKEDDAETASQLFAALRHFGVLTNGAYSHAIDALAKGGRDQVAQADALLRQFVDQYVFYAGLEGRCTAVRPPPTGSPTLPAVIHWNAGDSHHFPNHIRITGVMRGYARCGSPKPAEALLDLMIAMCSSPADGGNGGGDRRMFRPNEVAFATVIDAYSRACDGRNAQRMLERMKVRHFGNASPIVEDRLKKGMKLINGANVVAYNSAISAWARSAKKPNVATKRKEVITISSISRAAAENAERLLREMWKEHELNPRNTVLPDLVTYSTVISAYATCLAQPFGADRARELLAELERLAVQEYLGAHKLIATTQGGYSKQGGRSPCGFRPNATVYNTLLQAYANIGDAATAEAVLQAMVSLHESSLEEYVGAGPYRDVRPNTRTFNVVLNAWSKKGGDEGGRRAHNILERWEKTAIDENGPARPDVISYNTVLAAWSKSAGVDPATATSSSVVGKYAAFEALKLLDTLEQRHSESQKDRRRNHHSNVVVRPDVISYSTTIAAFANAAPHCDNGTAMAEEAEAILMRMRDRSGIEPDAYSYNGVILAWARSSGGISAARRAESILRSMRHPTIVSWSTVVNAYTHADGASRAAELLGEMEQKTTAYDCDNKSRGRAPILPSVVLYNNVLHAWRDSSELGASENAVALLNRMEDASSPTPLPDIVSYRLVPGWYPDKAARARAALHRQLASPQECRMATRCRDVRSAYNCVLAAATYTPVNAGKRQRNDAARILVETLRDMNQSVPLLHAGPDQESYALFVQGCAHLFDPDSKERHVLLKSAFHECCQRGLLNKLIWEKFCRALRPKVAQEFVREFTFDKEITKLDYEGLPAEWSRSNHPLN